MSKFLFSISIIVSSFICSLALAKQLDVQGIYISQTTLENSARIKNLITQAKEAGINTFVVDFRRFSPQYQNGINLIKQNNLRYVARIVVFPDNGGDPAQVDSMDYREKIYQLVEQAIKLGANEIQLDYLRYKSSQPPSSKNVQNIYQIIKWFKNKLQPQKIPLEVDVFGVTSFGDSIHIGQSVTVFANTVDALCPMVYPSHYEPYQKYAKMPYYIIDHSLKSLRERFNGNIPIKIYPYIETYNYRYPLSQQEKLDYITKQLAAVEDNNVDGWYVWNIHNDYKNLFIVLKNRQGSIYKVK